MFFKLDKTVYKSGNRVTIGRGAPFVQLSKDRSILRAHCKLIKKKTGFYLVKLNNRAAVQVNGKEIQLLKPVKIVNSDSVVLGEKLKLKQLDFYTLNDYETIRRFSLDLNAGKSIPWLIPFCLITLGVFGTLVAISFIQSDSSIRLVGKLIQALITSAFFISGFELIKRIKANSKEIVVKEIFIGKDGVTFHLERGNISIPFEKIEKLGKIRRNNFNIRAFKKDYSIKNIKNADKLYTIIDKLMNKEDLKPVKKVRGRQG